MGEVGLGLLFGSFATTIRLCRRTHLRPKLFISLFVLLFSLDLLLCCRARVLFLWKRSYIIY